MDLCHVGDSYLHAFTRAFARANPRGRLVQIHGFARGKRETLSARSADIILSDGSRTPPPHVESLAACLDRGFEDRAAAYPAEVQELGGTTNTHALIFRQARHPGFLHVELSLEARRALKGDRDLRQSLWRCLREKEQ